MRTDLLSLLAVSPFIILVFFLSNIRTTLQVVLITGPVLTMLSWQLLVQRNSYSRRKPIRDQVLRDQQAFDSQRRPSAKSEDDDWEQVPSKTFSKIATKKTPEKDYDGFIGFFHPFA